MTKSLKLHAMVDDSSGLIKIVTADGNDITIELALLLQEKLTEEITRLRDVEGSYEDMLSAAEDRRFC